MKFLVGLALGLALAVAPHGASGQSFEGPRGLAFADEGEAAAAFFVLEWLLDQDGQLEAAERFYADTVDYYALGDTARADVAADKRRFFARWPIRRYTPDLAAMTVETLADGAFRVVVEAEYAYLGADGEETAAGRAAAQFDLRRRGEGGFEVFGERGAVIRRDE